MNGQLGRDDVERMKYNAQEMATRAKNRYPFLDLTIAKSCSSIDPNDPPVRVGFSRLCKNLKLEADGLVSARFCRKAEDMLRTLYMDKLAVGRCA